jgi:TPR repeat protein/serine/threonine protein kinase
VLNEITTENNTDPAHYIFSETTFHELVKDVLQFPDDLNTFLSLMKHHPLSVYEARALKADLKKLVAFIDSAKESWRGKCELQSIHNAKMASLENENEKKRQQSTFYGSSSVETEKKLVEPRLHEKIIIPTTPVPPPAANFSQNYSQNYSQVEVNPEQLIVNQVYTKYNKNKVLEQYRLSPADIKKTKVLIEYGNFGNVHLGLYKNKNKITIKKLSKQDYNQQYFSEKLFLMHHLHSNNNPNANPDSSLANNSSFYGLNSINGPSSPFLQSFYGFISTEHSYQMIEELTSHGILETVLNDFTHFPFFQVNLKFSWLQDLIRGVSFLHSKGIVHSEITPGNILISDRLVLKIGNLHSCSDIVNKYKNQKNEEKVKDIYRILLLSPYIAPELKEMITTVLSASDRDRNNRSNNSSNNSSDISDLSENDLTPRKSILSTKNSIEFTMESDVYSFCITAFVIVFRRTPSIQDDIIEQLEEMLEVTNFYSEEAKELFSLAMGKGLSYQRISNNLAESMILVDRPKAEEISRDFKTIVKEFFGGDPRSVEEEWLDTTSYLSELEKTCIQLQNQRLKGTGLNDLIIKNFNLKVPSTDSYENPTYDIHGIVTSSNNNDNPNLSIQSENKTRHSIKNLVKSVYNVKHDQSVKLEKSDDRFVGSDSSCMNSAVDPKASASIHNYSQNYSRTFPTIGSVCASESIFEEKSKNMFHSDHLAVLGQFLREEASCTGSNAVRYAELLVNNGIPTVEILTKRIERDYNILVNLGFEYNDAIEVAEVLNSRKEQEKTSHNVKRFGTLNNFSSSHSITENRSVTTNKRLSQSQNNNNRNSSNTLTILSGANHSQIWGKEVPKLLLPTDIANYYEKATLRNDSSAFLELERLANTGDNFAKGFLIRILLLGQCGIKANPQLARQLSEGLFSWLEVIIQSANELAAMIGQFLLGFCYSEGLDGTDKDDKEALRWYKSSADRNYSMAQAYVGYCYYIGKGCILNHPEAVRWYKKAAEQGHIGAQSNLGLCYENGHGMKSASPVEAVVWYKKAAQQNYSIASYNLAYCYERGFGIQKDCYQAFYFYLWSIRQGNEMKSEYRIGLLFEENHLQISDKKVLNMKNEHFEAMGSEEAATSSMMHMAKIMNGEETFYDNNNNKDNTTIYTAITSDTNNKNNNNNNNNTTNYSTYSKNTTNTKQQQLSTKLNGTPLTNKSSSSMYNTSTDHDPFSHSDSSPDEAGHGIEVAKKYNRSSSSIVFTPARSNSSINNKSTPPLAKKPSKPAPVEKNNQYYHDQHKRNSTSTEHESFYWFFSSALKGNGDAQVKIGNYFEFGIGTSLNPAKAFRYYELANQQGNLQGKFYLAICYSQGIGCTPDYEKALFHYHEAASQGHKEAQNNLAYFYKMGLGVEKNLLEAMKWYQRAAEQGYSAAKYNLACLYEKNMNEINKLLVQNPQESVQSGQKVVKLQDIINLYVTAAQAGVDRAEKALQRVRVA